MVAAIFAAVAATAVLAALLLGPGRYDPSPPSLQGQPRAEIPGEVLYVDGDGCIVRAAASGATRTPVLCGGPYPSSVSWVNADTIGYANYGGPGIAWTEIDLRTGRQTTSDRLPQRGPPDPVSVRGERAEVDDQGSVYVLAGGERRKVFNFDGSSRLRPSFLTWSPDGDWLLLQYRDQLWIVRRDGSVAGTLAKTGGNPYESSWRIEGAGFLPKLMLGDTRTKP